jgi:uncharacterized repeat protein (TIGR01451 family)
LRRRRGIFSEVSGGIEVVDRPRADRNRFLRAASISAVAAVVVAGAATVLPATSAQAADGPAWACSSYGYLFQSPGGDTHQIYQVDLVSGASSVIANTADSINAVGYNPTDDYMYGYNGTTGGFAQVASDGTETQLPTPSGSVVGEYNIGDFDSDGHYWVTTNLGTAPRPWEEIDYAAGSPTYGQVIASGTFSDDETNGADWVYVDGALYSLLYNGHLMKFDTTTHASTDLGVLSGVPTNTVGFGAGYADSAGNVYFSDNETGEIYRVDPATLEVVDLSTGPVSSGNDGARCATAPIPTVTVVKDVAGRVQPTDQFTVGLNGSDSTTLTSATTTGTNATATTTDWPVSQGATYTITDAMAPGSPDQINAYGQGLVCVDSGGNTISTGGDPLAWTLTIANATAYTCTVTNTPADPSFTVSKTASKPTAHEGDQVTYTLNLQNTGTVPYTAANPASLTDDLSGVADDATYNGDASNGATVSGNTLSWSGPLAVGASETITYSVTVNNPDTGDHTLDNAVVPGNGGICTTDDSCETHSPVASYTVAKSASESTASEGDKVTYTVTVKNTGKIAYTAGDPASFDDDLSKALDDATYNGDASNGATVDGHTLSWSGALPVDAALTVTYSVTVNTPDAGDGILDNTVVPTGTDGSCASPDGCATHTPVTAYTVAKSASESTASEGDKVIYTVTVKNTGKAGYTADRPASFKDDLSKVLDDATYNGDASDGAKVDGNTLNWSGALAVGGTQVITYSVTVNTPDTGDHELDNTVVPTGPGGECAAEDGCATHTPVNDPPVAPVADPPDGPAVATGGTMLSVPIWPVAIGGGIAAAGIIAMIVLALYFRRKPDNEIGD